MLSFTVLLAGDPLDHVKPHRLFDIGGLTISNQMLMAVVAAVLMLLIFPRLFGESRADAPTGSRNFFEAILEFLRVEVFRPALKEHTDRFVPFLWTLFFFILFCNVLGAIPISTLVELFTAGKVQHLGGTATGNIATTAGLAIAAFFAIHASGIITIFRSLRDGTYGHHGHHEEHSSDGQKPGHEAAHDLEHVRGDALPADVPANFKALGNPTKHYHDDEHVGHTHQRLDDGHLHDHGGTHGHGMDAGKAAVFALPLYLWNFAPHPFKPAPGGSPIGWFADVPMWFFLLLLEMIGAVIKPFALMIRLFANMIAGHIVLAVLVGLIPVGAGVLATLGVGIPVVALSLGISLLELFVAFLQAYIFTFLTMLFLASAVAPEH